MFVCWKCRASSGCRLPNRHAQHKSTRVLTAVQWKCLRVFIRMFMYLFNGVMEPYIFSEIKTDYRGRGGSVGRAARYGLGGPRTASRGGRDFPHSSRPALGPIQPPIQWVPVFPRGKAAGEWRWPPTPIWRRGWRKSRAIPLLPLWAFVACSRKNFTEARKVHLS